MYFQINYNLGTQHNGHYFANGEANAEMAKQFRFQLAKNTLPARVSLIVVDCTSFNRNTFFKVKIHVLCMRKETETGELRSKIWSATDRTMSISKTATIDEVSQAFVSKLVLSDDFPHGGLYPLATLSVKV